MSVSQIATHGVPIGPIRIPGLDLDGTYWLEQQLLDEHRLGLAKQPPGSKVSRSPDDSSPWRLPMPCQSETALLLHLQRR